MNSILTGNLQVIMASENAARLGRPNAVSASFGDYGVQVGSLPTDQYSEGGNNDKMAQKVSGKLSAPVLEQDPSCSGLDLYTWIIVSQL